MLLLLLLLLLLPLLLLLLPLPASRMPVTSDALKRSSWRRPLRMRCSMRRMSFRSIPRFLKERSPSGGL